MTIKTLLLNPQQENDKKVIDILTQFRQLLSELEKRKLPGEIIEQINKSVESINTSEQVGKTLAFSIKKEQTVILKLLEKELKIVPKNHYRTLWMLFGFTAFGLPIGVVFGTLLGNMGFLGCGLPIGMMIGLALGSALDRKAKNEGRQLEVEIKK